MVNLRNEGYVKSLLSDAELRTQLSAGEVTATAIDLLHEAKVLLTLANELTLLAGKLHADEFQKAKQVELVQAGHKYGYLCAEAIRNGATNTFRFFLLFPFSESERHARLAANPRTKILFKRKNVRMINGKYPPKSFEPANNPPLQALATFTENAFAPLRNQSSHIAKARAQVTYALKNWSKV